METALWTIQAILAAAFIPAGLMKLFSSLDKLGQKLTWIPRHSAGLVRFIGLTQLLAGLGFILPWYFQILPILTPLAGIGIAITMFFAILEHIKYKEYPNIVINAIFLGLSAVVAYERLVQLEILNGSLFH